MKIRLGKVNVLLQGLRSLEKNVFPSKLSYAISYNTEKLESESKRIEKERIKICERFFKKDEDGNPVKEKIKKVVNDQVYETEVYVFDSKKAEADCNKEIEALFEEEVDIAIRTVKQELIEECFENEKYTTPTVAATKAMYFMTEE